MHTYDITFGFGAAHCYYLYFQICYVTVVYSYFVLSSDFPTLKNDVKFHFAIRMTDVTEMT